MFLSKSIFITKCINRNEVVWIRLMWSDNEIVWCFQFFSTFMPSYFVRYLPSGMANHWIQLWSSPWVVYQWGATLYPTARSDWSGRHLVSSRPASREPEHAPETWPRIQISNVSIGWYHLNNSNQICLP